MPVSASNWSGSDRKGRYSGELFGWDDLLCASGVDRLRNSEIGCRSKKIEKISKASNSSDDCLSAKKKFATKVRVPL